MDENTSDQVNWMFVSQGRPWDPELDPDKESGWHGGTYQTAQQEELGGFTVASQLGQAAL